MNVPFFSFSNAPRKLKSQWKKSLINVVNRGIFIQGPEVKKFEPVNYVTDMGSFYPDSLEPKINNWNSL